MDKLDRLYQLHHLLSGRRTPIALAQLASEMECSEKSAKRYLDQHRLFYNAPLEYISRKGWQIIPGMEEQWEIPGLWMTEQDVQSLLLLLDILHRFGNGLLNHELQAIETKITRILEQRGIKRSELESRIKIIPIGQRALPTQHLKRSFQALIQRKHLHIDYCDFNNKQSQRDVSPQRLTYYRDNWYLDAWCHQRQALRTFSLARIKHSQCRQESAIELTTEQLDAHFTPGFGVFAGAANHQAKLRFLPKVAREVASQQWHPHQQGEWDGDNYLLTLPYSHAEELIQDIQRQLPHVIVEAPAELKSQLIKHLQQTLAQHEK